MKKLPILTLLALGSIALPGQAQIMQTVSGYSGGDWDSAEWGTPAAVPTSGNAYISTAGLDTSSSLNEAPNYTDTVRALDNVGTNTFAGSSLTLAGNTRLLLKQTNGDIASANLILQNNSDISYAPNSYNVGTLNGKISVASGVTGYIGGGNLGSGATFNINSTLTGLGTLDVYNATNVASPIVFGGILSGFGGDLDFIGTAAFSITTTNLLGTTLTFSNSVDSAMASAGGSSFAINNAINVAGLMLGSSSLGAGSYTASQLNSDIGGGSTFFTGSFDITVAPEPSVYALMLTGLALLIGIQAMRRRTA